MSKRSKYLLIALLVVPPGMALTGYGCADRFILPPVPGPTKGDGSPRFEIPWKTGVLEVYCAKSPGAADTQPRAFVLRFIGDANQATRFTASRWQDRPVEAWVVNYPGYGGSSGPRTLRALADAALAAYDALEKAAAARPIILEGLSLGTVPALHVAAHRPVAGLILQNGPPLKDTVLSHGWWNLWLIAGPVAWGIPDELDSIANAAKCKAKAFFMISEKDETVLPEHQFKIFTAYAGPKRQTVQAGAGHVDPLDAATEKQLHEAMDWMMSREAEPR